jgi:CBS domain-containing protein
MSEITVGDIMKCDPYIISPDKTVKAAAQLMKEIDSGILPVGTHPEKIVGIITDRDIVLRVTAEGKYASEVLIQDAMTPKVYSCTTETALEDAANLMCTYGVRRLVVTKQNRITGIITLIELLRNEGKVRLSDKVLHALLGIHKNHPMQSVRVTG